MSRRVYNRSHWRPDRLALALKIRGWDAVALRIKLNEARASKGEARVDQRPVRGWVTGETSPMFARSGMVPKVFEIADVLGVSVDWLTGRTNVEPGFTKADRERFADEEGWT